MTSDEDRRTEIKIRWYGENLYVTGKLVFNTFIYF